MKIKNATIKDFDTAYEYIKKLWDYNTYDYETTKEVYEKVLQDENSFAFFSIEDDGTFSWILPWRLFSDLLDVRAYLLCIKFDHKRRRPR